MVRSKLIRIFSLALVLVAVLALSQTTPSSALTVATLPGRMGPERQISSTITPFDLGRGGISATYNSNQNEFLVVWSNFYTSGLWDISAQRITSTGEKIGSWFTISNGVGNRMGASVAFNAAEGKYLVVFMKDVSTTHDGSKYDIIGQFINWDGTLLGGSFTIQTWNNQTFYGPKVAYNDRLNEYMVVWTGFEGSWSGPAWIGLKILENNGTIRFGTILTDTGNPKSPDISWNTDFDNYMVVWNKTNASGKRIIMGCLINFDGTRIIPPGVPAPGDITIYNSDTIDSDSPVVASSAGIFGVAYPSGPSGEIYLSLIASSIGLVASPRLLETNTTGGYYAIAGNPRSHNTEFMLIFQKTSGEGLQAWLHSIRFLLPDTSQVVCINTNHACYPYAIAQGGAGYLMVYTKVFPPPEQIYGRMFWVFNMNLPFVNK